MSKRLDTDDRRRYFIVGSVILEIVTPVFRQRLVKDYKGKGLGCLQDFINSKPVIHILFHLRHTNIKCCVDTTNCRNRRKLPLNYSQWDLLYTENPGPPKHHCHCLYTTNNVKLDDLDITLASLILLNCCNLTHNEETLIKELREFKNNYLSHNTKGAISEKEYQTLWNDLMTRVLQLDPSKQDDFIRIQNRPLDDSLCNKYFVCLLDIHKKLEEISDKLSSTADILTAMNINNGQSNVELFTKLEEILQYVRWQSSKVKTDRQVIKQQHKIQSYKLGQSIFTLHHQTDLTSVGDGDWRGVLDIVMSDDGRLVMCLPLERRLLICNTDGSQVDSIDIQGMPWCVTPVNNSTVAVTLWCSKCIEVYDINNKLKLKSISPPGMWRWSGITTINNKIVVDCDKRLHIIDHQTGKVVKTIQTDCDPYRFQGCGDRLFYCDNKKKKLYWYSYTDDTHHTLTLPSTPRRMTTVKEKHYTTKPVKSIY
ncbi:Hypothetical predicted protein [Mytilus galloprovincialis]|uniref:DZIP3-like HEPN domain-containing protein n=1 Tax=Mytilus galloprovincialis TaxID=29158 RepID=A0A8B6ETX5_MYTGA|nr:Hypothetical predicted protein [Mytilus galloprovincialis]